MSENLFKKLIRRWFTCEHKFQYSRSRPGTVVCKRCGARRGKPQE